MLVTNGYHSGPINFSILFQYSKRVLLYMLIRPRAYMIIAYVWYKLFLNFFVHLEYILVRKFLMNHDLFVKTSVRTVECVQL